MYALGKPRQRQVGCLVKKKNVFLFFLFLFLLVITVIILPTYSQDKKLILLVLKESTVRFGNSPFLSNLLCTILKCTEPVLILDLVTQFLFKDLDLSSC